MLSLQCQVQRYAWGKMGAESMVARVKKAADPSFTIDPTECFAEYWIGTHPSGPSTVASTGEPLSAWLQRNPEALGRICPEYSPGSLVFLMKILSIRTALSIQAHPDKKLAQKLFVEDPAHYKDPNHKPEMVIALTPFEAMCGFRPISEIKKHIETYPEFSQLLGDDVVAKFSDPSFGDDISEDVKRSTLRELFSRFMNADSVSVSTKVGEMINRIRSPCNGDASSDTQESIVDIDNIDQLMGRLNTDFPGDIGVMCPLLLNCVRLAPGHSFFCGPSEPHAYISGDCIECMAPSDNVIRSGLTPKFKDVDVLCDMLTYSNGKLGSEISSIVVNENVQLYRPPFAHAPEFEVERAIISSGAESVFEISDVASILLIIRGVCKVSIDALVPAAGSELCNVIDAATGGTVIFVSAGHSFKISAAEVVEVYRAHINLSVV